MIITFRFFFSFRISCKFLILFALICVIFQMINEFTFFSNCFIFVHTLLTVSVENRLLYWINLNMKMVSLKFKWHNNSCMNYGYIILFTQMHTKLRKIRFFSRFVGFLMSQKSNNNSVENWYSLFKISLRINFNTVKFLRILLQTTMNDHMYNKSICTQSFNNFQRRK